VGPAVTVAEVKGIGLNTARGAAERAAAAGATVEAEAVDATAVPAPAATRVAAAIRAARRGRRERWFMWKELFTVVEVSSLIRISEGVKMISW
jgi:hypothetical protein